MKMNNRVVSGVLGAFLLIAGPLRAQAETGPGTEAEPTEVSDADRLEREKKAGAKLSGLPGFDFKIDGVVFTGFELTDYDQAGQPDSVGPAKDSAGFKVGRAYINFNGAVKDGDFKDWGFRITTDVARAATQGDGCGSTCDEDNDNNVNLKYAYVNIPVPFLNGVFGKNMLRLGQQHSPVVDGQAGVSLQKYWDHRYVDQAATEKVGMSSSTDIGLGFLHQSDYVGLHLLLANGEGYHSANAQKISNTSSSDLAKGSGDSYGMDLYGQFSVIPTGKNKTINWSVSLPFRLHNFYGVTDDEARSFSADVSSNTGTNYEMLYREGDTRAKRDVSYGVETDVKIDLGDFQFILGAGNVTRLDKRGAVTTWRVASTAGSPTDTLSRSENRDAVGFANYIFASVRWRYIGAFGRLIHGTSTTSLSAKFSPIDSKTSWMGQALALDSADGQYGNLNLSTADNSIDHGEGRYNNAIYGLTFYPSATANFFRISIGVSELWGNNQTGREYRTNVFENYTGSAVTSANTKTIAAQLEGNSAIKSAVGYRSSDTLVLNDFIGSKIDTRQVFIRAQFIY